MTLAATDVAPSVADKETEYFHRDGYTVVEGVVGADVCDELLTHVSLMTQEADRQGRTDLFGNIQESVSRWDLKLELCRPVVQALNQFSLRCAPILNSFVGNPAIKIVELAAITSAPGAVAQPVHADTMHGITRYLQSDIDLPIGRDVDGSSDEEETAEDLTSIVRAVATETAIICTALVALQDVEEDMGPTHVWPGTNTVEHHATLWGTSVGGKLHVAEADEAFKVEHKKMTLKKGDLILYDSRTMHCGGANTSENKRRSVLVISVMGPGIRPDGTTWTILPALRNRLFLQKFPLDLERANAPVASLGSEISLPAQATVKTQISEKLDQEYCNGKPIPPLDTWEACVQCATCRQWRPCSTADAPRFANAERGYICKMSGYICTQPQKYSQADIDAALA
jgi:ectoine hydroxylase-related dioxygenase (phytanoyl-CoA dioxygenase family)